MALIRIEDILEKLQKEHPQADISLVRQAYVFSAQQHKDQLRQSGEPYLTHPLEVANILAEMHLDAVAVAVGLLHDVLEDTLTTMERLHELFGPEVAKIVAGVTKISKITFTSFEEKQAENFRKLLMAMVDDIRVILVKLADRLHNMRTLGHLEQEKQIRIATETTEIFVPIAHRLGMGRTKAELEDLSFKHLESEAYDSIKRRVERELPVNEAYIAKVLKRMEDAMTQNSIPCSIVWRIKGIHSIYSKRRRMQKLVSSDYDFHDYIAFRIITDEVKHCYAALGILHNLWKPVPGQFDDYIANPKMNNYQSLHTVLVDREHRFEVQIRTGEMHRIAEEGIASHWRYKEGKKPGERESWIDRYYDWLRQVLELQRDTDDARQFMNALMVDLAPDEVYTFTPKGKLLALPRGSTPIDFAYAIHTEIGNTCVGAKVSGRMVALDTDLHSGDTVEIITSKGHGPNRDWLSIVKTGRARNKIRQYLNRQEKDKSIEVGRRLMEKELKRHGIALKRLQAQEGFDDALKDMGLSSIDDLFSSVGFGRVSARSFLAKIFPEPEAKEPPEALTEKIAKTIRRSLGLGKGAIKVKGADDLLTYISPCCSPVFGEPIIGYVTRGKGIAVHRADCPNVEDFHPDRQITVEWAGAREGTLPARVIINAEDKQGILAKIMARIDGSGVDVRGLTAEIYDDKTVEISLTLEVRDIKQLNSILKSLKEISEVLEIRRQ
ncbi:MAG TPA: bifunctional (p)ppGpp synthetase/guanosine-3',5'-bis(diphosphate) 3'-pyrophosphohydrolase [Acidobacteriota bacterium]|nr:bifunctional (p)ppGpp synthetase/guanosine-3',5'-bis(diphosphate) 3'-pyrophosphohydrolase [Acidobacteriota bacterium]